jgi:hypothetical protein
MAINVLVEHIASIDRGLEYGNMSNKPEVWSRLAKAQLDGLRIKDAIGELFICLVCIFSFVFFFRLVHQGCGPLQLR